jgi:UrcA family protein
MNRITRSKPYAVIYCAFGAAALCTLTSPAGAAENDPPSKIVRFDDLNIANPAGAKVLYHRIQAAAQQVCGPPVTRDLQRVALERACIEKAIDDAVRGVNAIALTELRFGKVRRLASN